jgi:hypothetical protein
MQGIWNKSKHFILYTDLLVRTIVTVLGGILVSREKTSINGTAAYGRKHSQPSPVTLHSKPDYCGSIKVNVKVKVKVKVKFALEQATKNPEGRRGIVPLFL